MITLQPLIAVKEPGELLARIPPELRALADQAEPWTSYVAFTLEGIAVGACAFKSAPTRKKEVKIAYLTFPEFERQGYGAAMSRALIAIAAGSQPVDGVIARTFREENASVHICRRLDFLFEGDNLDPEDGLVWRWSKKIRPNSVTTANLRADARPGLGSNVGRMSFNST